MATKKDVIINGTEFTFINETYSNSSNWGHKTKLFEGNELIGEGKAVYYNRTWESYEYQSVMKSLVYDLIDSEIQVLKDDFKAIKKIKRLTKKWAEEFTGFLRTSRKLKDLEQLKKAL